MDYKVHTKYEKKNNTNLDSTQVLKTTTIYPQYTEYTGNDSLQTNTTVLALNWADVWKPELQPTEMLVLLD